MSTPLDLSKRPKDDAQREEKPRLLAQRAWSIDLRLLVAVLVLLYHGVLSIYGTYRNTYDAYVHIFFADHWAPVVGLITGTHAGTPALP